MARGKLDTVTPLSAIWFKFRKLFVITVDIIYYILSN